MTIDLRKIMDYLKRLPIWRRAGLIIGVLSLAVVFIGAISGFFRWQNGSQLREKASPIITEIADPTPSQTPTTVPTPKPSPTPELRSTAYVVWTNHGPGIYLRDQPGGLAIGVIHNGTVLTEIDLEVQRAKGLDWVQVVHMEKPGWVARHLIYIMEGSIFLVGNGGAWMYEEIEGRVDTRLQPGTPYELIEVDPISNWLKVRLPNGREGWLKSR